MVGDLGEHRITFRFWNRSERDTGDDRVVELIVFCEKEGSIGFVELNLRETFSAFFCHAGVLFDQDELGWGIEAFQNRPRKSSGAWAEF